MTTFVVLPLLVLACGAVVLLLVIGTADASGRPRVLRAAAVLAAVRLVFLWLGGYFYRETAGELQPVGYLMLMFVMPESLLVGALVRRPMLWSAALSVLLIVGSALWVFLAAAALQRRAARRPGSG